MMGKMTAFLAVCLFGGFAGAQGTNSNSLSSSELKTTIQTGEKTQEEIDKEITNAKMRAELGSKSKISIKMALTYNGGSIERPFDEVRPNYRAGANAPELSSLSGTIGIKYSLTERDSLSFGTGVSVLTPFNGNGAEKFEDPRRKGNEMNRYEVSTPYVSYTRAYRVGGMQMISGASYYHSTDSDSVKEMGQLGYVSLLQTIATEIGSSGWTGGAQVALYKYLWNGDMTPESQAAGYRQIDYIYGIYPFAEYSFTDRYSFRTVFGYFANMQYRDSQNKGSVIAQVPYQSVGLGVSITRDIYLYPNVQFTPFDIRADRTNVGLSANVSVF